MTDEPTTPTPEPEPEAEAPQTTKEQVAAFLGIPVEEVDTAKNVGKLYSRANDYNRDAKALFDKAQSAQPATQMVPTADDTATDFDEATKKALDALIQNALGPVLFEQQQRHIGELQDTIDDFHGKHSSEPTYSYDSVVNAINELGLSAVMNNPATTPAQVRKVLSTAYKYVQAETIDVEKLAEQKAADIIAQAKEKGEEVVSIKPRRPSPSSAQPDIEDPNLTPDQRLALVKKELQKK